jgi:predicted phosphoribosyltransferase
MFQNRRDAGKLLAERLSERGYQEPVVLALPRGGVPVGFEIALALGAPLDILAVRKIGAPFQPELGVGALVDGDSPHALLDRGRIMSLGLREEDLAETIHKETSELRRRERLYRGGRPAISLSGRTVILVDDGIATGSSVRAALRSLRGRGLRRLVLAVPVGPPETLASLEPDAVELVCLEKPSSFRAVGEFYDDFSPVSDEEVVGLLDRARWLGTTSSSPPSHMGGELTSTGRIPGEDRASTRRGEGKPCKSGI